jgi:hypothetical protein
MIPEEYYSSRIDFSKSNENLSALVFLSGWERAFLNFIETTGIGIGFQQLGYSGAIGQSRLILESIGLGGLNLYDGGSLASKLISETGILGIILLFFYISYFIKYVITYRRYPKKKLFFISIFFMFSIYKGCWLFYTNNIFICNSSFCNKFKGF